MKPRTRRALIAQLRKIEKLAARLDEIHNQADEETALLIDNISGNIEHARFELYILTRDD